MRALPLSIGTLHFVGIGGIGMSGIAEVLHNLGYAVQGSDMAETANVQRLRKLGIRITVGHAAENIHDAQGEPVAAVIISTAIPKDNPEVIAARDEMVPVVRRAEMLAELMRLKWCVSVGGTHGKTTTTSLVGNLLERAGFDPTVINGGIVNAYGTNTRLGDGDWMVVEADESDGTFVRLPSTIAIVTNIDAEHLDFYGDFDAVKEAFRRFVDNVPFYGFAAMCIDDANVQALLPDVSDRRIVTYGINPQADIRAVNIANNADGCSYDVELSARVESDPDKRLIKGVELPMLGMHNVRNSLATVAVGVEMGVSQDIIRTGFKGFEGVKRRFTKTGESNGITVIDDYGHHPVEITAVLSAARAWIAGRKSAGEGEGAKEGKVIAVMQPHRYSRLSSLFEDFCTCFNNADQVIIADVYAAGEKPVEGADRDALVAGLKRHGHRKVAALDAPEALPGMIAEMAQPGDLVVCLGAGNITQWANALPGDLDTVFGKSGKAASGGANDS